MTQFSSHNQVNERQFFWFLIEYPGNVSVGRYFSCFSLCGPMLELWPVQGVHPLLYSDSWRLATAPCHTESRSKGRKSMDGWMDAWMRTMPNQLSLKLNLFPNRPFYVLLDSLISCAEQIHNVKVFIFVRFLFGLSLSQVSSILF